MIPLLRTILKAAALLLAAAAPAAVLPNPTITSSATPFSAAFPASNVFDGSMNEYASATRGAGAAFSTSAGTWIQFDFGAPVTTDRFIMVARANAADIIGTSRLVFSNDAVFDATDTIHSFNPSGSNASGIVQTFPSTTARYVRWEVATSTGSSQNLGSAEIRFLNTSAGKAVLPATVIGSATPFNASYAAANAVNGNAGRGTGLEYACLSLGAGMYVDFDFGTSQPISGFDFFDRIPTVDRTSAFNLIFSSDAVFGNAGDVTLSFTSGQTGWGFAREFSPVNARYVRFDATTTNSASNNSGIQEIVFYRDVNLNLPAIANSPASAITASSATLAGDILRPGSDTPSVTIFYGTTNGGSDPAAWQQSLNLGPQSASFSSPVTGLLPFTRYFHTSRATNSTGEAWAPVTLDFATPVAPPVIANLPASDLTIATARLGASITSSGGKAPVVTLFYGPTDGGTAPAAWSQRVSLGAVSTSASTVIGGLSPASAYFFRVFASNEAGSVWAPESATFSTPVAALPVITNSPASEINAFSALLAGNLSSSGNAPTSVTIFWGPADGGTNPASWAFSLDLGLLSGPFTSLVTNLPSASPVFFRSRASNAAGTTWAPDSATFSTTAFAPVTVYLNEFVAATDNDDPRAVLDADGAPQDWIELHNPAASAIDIGGYYLTDSASQRTKWRFPTPTIIPANGFLLVFASNKNRAVSGAELHTNFRLAGEGEYLALIQPDGTTIVKDFAPAFPTVPEYWSFGLTLPPSNGTYAPFQIPTPRAANSTTAGPPAGDVIFSIPSRSFTTAPLSLTLTTASPTAQIRYTTNRTEPNGTSTLYTGPISLATTTMVRARTFETAPGFAPGLVRTQSYTRLGTAAASFSSNLPVVVVDNFAGGLPTTDRTMFWTLFAPDAATSNRSSLTNTPVIATRGRMVIRGSSSAGWPKYSMNIEAWDEFGEDTPVAPLGMAPEADWVLQSNYDFDRGMIRNPFMYEFSNRIGRWAPRWRFVEVFSNTNDGTLDYPGDYMGVYAIMEKPERGADRIDVERLDTNDLAGEDVTGGYIVKVDRLDPGTSGWVTSRNFPLTEPFGSEVRLNYGYPEEAPSPAPVIPAQQSKYIRDYIQAFEDAVVQPNRINPATGLHYTDYIDRDSWVDHGLLNILAQNADCFRLSTYMHKPRNGKLFAGPIWDFDRTIGSTDSRSTNPTGWSATQPATDILTWGWWKYLWTEPDFWQRYTDRWFALRDSTLTTASLTGLVTQFESQLTEAAVRNYAKWTATPPRDGPDAGTTATFSDEMDIVRNWLTQRTTWLDSQFTPRPVRSPAGGRTDSVTLAATQGTIHYTLDGSDPRLPGGAINPAALTTPSGSSVTIAQSSLLFARARTSTQWSAPSTGYYFSGTPAAAGNLAVSEIHYHPADPSLAEIAVGFRNSDDFEFLELINTSANPIDLSGSRFTTGIDFTFPLGTILTPGQRTIIVASRAAFAVRYPAINFSSIAGEYSGDRLENAGETLTLTDAAGATILSFSYLASGLWPDDADGSGPSLVAITPGSAPDQPLNWRASTQPGGSPLGSDAISFASWLAAFSLTDPADDSDGDGINAFGEYAAGSNPTTPGLADLPIVTPAAPDTWSVTVFHAPGADDAYPVIETASDPASWSPAPVTPGSRMIVNGREEFTFSVPQPPGASRFFIRTRWIKRP